MIDILILIAGLILILLGANYLVDGASAIAKRFGISDFIIGMTIVGIGTSTPEMVVSFLSAAQANADIAVGNVVGSNIFNVLFVLASSAVITPMGVNALCLTDMLILIAVALFAYVFCITKNKVNRVEGVILAASYVAYLVYAIIR